MYTLSAVSYHAGILDLDSELVVRGVFSRAWHLQDRDGWVMTVANVPYNGPLAIRVEQRLSGFLVSPGHKGRLLDGALAVGEVQVRLDMAKTWAPSALSHARTVRHQALQEDVRAALGRACGARPESLVGIVRGWADSDLSFTRAMWRGPQPAWLRRAAVEIEGVGRALCRGDQGSALQRASGLLGLGPGLTPAGDDFLCGLLAGLRAFLPEWEGQYLLANQLASLAGGRTTSLSHTLLAQAAHGVVVEPLAAVVGTMGTGEGVRGLDELLAIGHSSGSDMLAGACLAAMIALEREGMGAASMVAPA